jgi:hypothetical protein
MPWRTASARSQCSGSLAVPPKEVLTSTRACQAANGLLTRAQQHGQRRSKRRRGMAYDGDGLRRRLSRMLVVVVVPDMLPLQAMPAYQTVPRLRVQRHRG